MKRRWMTIATLAGAVIVAAGPALAQRALEEARLVQARDGVLFVITEGVRYRVTPQQMSEAELGAIHEGPPLPVGLLAPGPAAAEEPSAAPSPTPGPRTVRPEPGQGLSRETALPLGVTCSCLIDRAGRVSQFDITIARVLQDAYPFLQQANRFNRPPGEGSRYVGVLVDVRYIEGPEDQAYRVEQSDFRASAPDDLLRDPTALIDPEPRLRADIYPGSTLIGWVFFELPRDQPTAVVWQTSFFGERGVWFALQ